MGLHHLAPNDALRKPARGWRRTVSPWVLAGSACVLSAATAVTDGFRSPLPAAGAAAALAAVLAARTQARRATRHGAASAAAAEQERRRIARDLHDGVAQTLSHLRMELDMLSHPQFTASLEPSEIARLARVAERTLGDVRGLIRDLAAPLPAGGLAQALAVYVPDVQTSHGPRISLTMSGSPTATPDVEGALFRIAQEAISNAVRHAGAREVRVLLTDESGGVDLTVEDDGVGIRTSGAHDSDSGGFGLAAMHERAEAAGLRLSIGPAPGGGTRVRARLELPHAPGLIRTA